MTLATTPETPARPASELKLERRREQLQRSRDRASTAETAVRDAEARLRALDVTRQDAQRRLKAAEQEIAALKKQLKRNAKERQQLQAERKKARKRGATLAESVRAAESRYDKAVLADLVRREKERDLAVHAEGAAPAAPGFTVVDRRETPRTDQVARPDPAVVPADPAPAKVSGRSTGTRAPRVTASPSSPTPRGSGSGTRAAAAGTAAGGTTARTARSRGRQQ